MTYRSAEEWEHRFSRKKIKSTEPLEILQTFDFESYLHHVGQKFAKRFDPNSSLYLSKAKSLDFFSFYSQA